MNPKPPLNKNQTTISKKNLSNKQSIITNQNIQLNIYQQLKIKIYTNFLLSKQEASDLIVYSKKRLFKNKQVRDLIGLKAKRTFFFLYSIS